MGKRTPSGGSAAFWAVFACIITFIFTALVFTVGAYAWGNSQWKKKADVDSKKIKLLEKKIKLLEKENGELKQSTQKLEQQDEYAGWQTYENNNYGYTMKYPADWTVEHKTEADDGSPADWLLFSSPDKTYSLSFGIRNKGDTIAIMGRTGTGAGDFEALGTAFIGSTEVHVMKLVFEGKVKLISYGGASGTKTEIDSHEVTAEFNKKYEGDYKDYSIDDPPEKLIADKILKSFQLK
jgi:hypothetical protein